MNRRDFIKVSFCAGCSIMLPKISWAQTPLTSVQFNPVIYTANKPQTIMIFLYGGASELAGNFTNYNNFKDLSDSNYEAYFGSSYVTATTNGFWRAAGGDIMETLLAAGDLNVFRTCYSSVRNQANNKSHGSCTKQNQRGDFSEVDAGIFANLSRILMNNGLITADTKMPFLTMEGDSDFFANGNLTRVPILEPIAINEDLDNPFSRDSNPSYGGSMDQLAQSLNPEGKIKDAFTKRAEMEVFINEIKALPDPVLGVDAYADNAFANKLKTAIKILNHNPDTQIISLGSEGLGGWDDHSNADNYLNRMNLLFNALKSAVAHIKSVGKMGNINIMVMSEFGRGVNLNSAHGWDHGNLQTFYVLGGTNYFNTPGVVGTTQLESTGSVNRLYLEPAGGSYWFEPASIAATIYRIYGITNPEVLTANNPPITPLLG